ncbi:MAG: D-aminoacyl-tRNA deacylase [Armatimonadota bacterium]
MRILIQRTTRAAVIVEGQSIASIGKGYLVFLGVGQGDTDADAQLIAQKIVNLRLFEDENGKTNLCLADVGGELLLVSQFTLYGDVRKGRRPGFSEASSPEEGERLYLLTAELLRQQGVAVQTGQFGAHMAVELCNDGPFTIWFDSRRQE